MPKRPHIHTAKFRRCVKKVMAKSRGKYNPFAVCSAAIPYEGRFQKMAMASSSMFPNKGIPREAILKMLKSPKTPKQLKVYWRKRLKRVI